MDSGESLGLGALGAQGLESRISLALGLRDPLWVPRRTSVCADRCADMHSIHVYTHTDTHKHPPHTHTRSCHTQTCVHLAKVTGRGNCGSLVCRGR